MELSSLIAEFHKALDDEIEEARKGRGQQYRLHDGRRLGAHNGKFLYTFFLDVEVHVPDDNPVEVELKQPKESRTRGSVVAVEGLTIMLELEDDLGEEIPSSVLRSEPWYLLEELKKRLSENLSKGAVARLASLMNIKCGNCGSPVAPRKGPSGFFLGCQKYPRCNWTCDIASLV